MDGADNNILSSIQLSYSQQAFLIDAQVAQSVFVVAAIFITHKHNFRDHSNYLSIV